MITVQNVSRRGFLQGVVSAGAFVLCARVLPSSVLAAAPDASINPVDGAVLHPSVFVGIETDGTVFIIAHRSEMGTGVRTSLPRVLADEMDADWNRVKVVQADASDKYGSQDTDGSHSVRDFMEPLLEAGATARLMLVRAAAQQWGIPESQCVADPVHTVADKSSSRKLSYGELASAAAKLPVPKKEELQFKPRSSWRYIGKPSKPYDLESICTGKPLFGMDVQRENMLYAAVLRSPVIGGKMKTYDDKAALQVPGVRKTAVIEPCSAPYGFQALGGIAVIADNTFAAFKGRGKLKVDWDNGPNAGYNSDQYKKDLQQSAREPGKVVREIGNVDAEFAKGGKIIEAEYYVPHLAHASMEPPVAVADVQGNKATIWAPTQDPQGVRKQIAQTLKLDKEDVTCHVTLLGGGFGRKSKHDFSVEAAVLSQKMGQPVKVVWSREDDIRFDYFHTVSAMYMKAAVDEKGKPTAWLQRSSFPPIASTFALNQVYGGFGDMTQGWNDVPFDLANHRAENGRAEAHVRIGWLRSVANIYHAFAVQSFADELAHAAGRDPVEYLLELIGPSRNVDLGHGWDRTADKYPLDTARLKNVIQIAAENSGWAKRKLGKGVGMGIAAHWSFFTYVASVVEVEVDDKNQVRIPRVFTALDAGTVVNPETVRQQFEGAAVFGTSIARTGEITATNGAIDQSNFYDYQVSRMNQAPYETHVHIVESTAPPAGVGEPGVPPMSPAICNAIFAATGKRVRELPLTRNNFS